MKTIEVVRKVLFVEQDEQFRDCANAYAYRRFLQRGSTVYRKSPCYVLNLCSKTLLQERSHFFKTFDYIITTWHWVTNF